MCEATRQKLLMNMVEKDPNDDFARYGLALEYRNAGLHDKALQQFEELKRRHPDYVAGYFMAGQMLAELDRMDEARQWLSEGIQVAERTGDSHAHAEMTEYLEEIG